jgi:Holliday junction resolvase RusA-like endonuclease
MKKLQFHQFFDIRPRSKGRPRMTRSGRAYTPKLTAEYEAAIGSMYKGPMFEEGLLSVKLRFTAQGTELLIERVEENPNVEQPKRKLTGDIDNYAKSLLDGLNGVAYTDDKQIVILHLEKA